MFDGGFFGGFNPNQTTSRNGGFNSGGSSHNSGPGAGFMQSGFIENIANMGTNMFNSFFPTNTRSNNSRMEQEQPIPTFTNTRQSFYKEKDDQEKKKRKQE